MAISKFTWAEGDVSLYNNETSEQFKIRDGRITQISRATDNKHINGGYRYKTIKTAKGIAHVNAMLVVAVETNKAEF